MRRLVGTVAVAAAAISCGVPAAHAADRCVGPGAGCAATLQEALDAASDGDTIHLGAGSFQGGVTIDKSVELAGAGQHDTFITGGGPVLTIGTFGADSAPTVGIRDLTITGGRTTSSPESLPFGGVEGLIAAGGGISIPPTSAGGDDLGPGATVTLTRTTVRGNRAAPSVDAPFGPPCPGDVPCPFALAAGGGVSNWGDLTLADSTVADNRIGSASGLSDLASDAEGGGILAWDTGTLTVLRSRITGNRASAVAPNGRFAEGGGIMLFGGDFTMRDSVVADNRAFLGAGLPDSVETVANGGGVHITGGVPTALVERSTFKDNRVRGTNSAGSILAYAGGIEVDDPVEFTMTDSLIAGNGASADGPAGALAHADSGGGQLFGRMTGTRVRGNVARATGDGDAEAFAGGMWVLFGDVQDSAATANRISAAAAHGTAQAGGAGFVSDTGEELAGLTLTRSLVDRNRASVSGDTSIAEGGGIYTAFHSFRFGPIGGPLTITDSKVTHNVLTGRRGAVLRGGGVFAEDEPVTLAGALIAGNVPDQCFGCGGGAGRPAAGARRTGLATREMPSAAFRGP